MPEIQLPPEYVEHYEQHRATIARRLAEFATVPSERYLAELLYCLLTPGSRARHAEIAMERLLALGFPERDVDPTPILRDPACYIRFHNQKSQRLRDAAAMSATIATVLSDPALGGRARRDWLVANVNGLGWKEASHFLRNIGHFELAIIDRHVLKHLHRVGIIDAVPESIGSRQRYLDLEADFTALAHSAGLTLQELDLLFWSFEEGSVRK